jgi:hypothetical protein
MSKLLNDDERRLLTRIAQLDRRGRGRYYARALLALDGGSPPEEVARILRLGLRAAKRKKEAGHAKEIAPDEAFERDLDYVLDKNAELYRRLAQ